MTTPNLIDTFAPEWHRDAACRPTKGHDPDLWFPVVRGGNRPIEAQLRDSEGIAICRQCPVRLECLRAGENEPDGIWGGKYRTSTPSVRRRMEGGGDAA